MKVVRRASGGEKWTKEFTCQECQVVLEVEESDLHVLNRAVSYAGETWEPEVAFTCPDCHSENDVTNNLPSGISSRLIEQARDRLRRK